MASLISAFVDISPDRSLARYLRQIRNHHAYLTASINEPGGNHQDEGALCGLPCIAASGATASTIA